MVLQPICDALVRPALAMGKPVRLSIAATRNTDRLRLTVMVGPDGVPIARERLKDVRRTLDAMFAPHARIEQIEPPGGAAGVSVEIPYASAPSADC
jgi:hypothetical protein